MSDPTKLDSEALPAAALAPAPRSRGGLPRRRWWVAAGVALLGGLLAVGGVSRADDMGRSRNRHQHINHVLDAAEATPAQRTQVQAIWTGLRPQLHTLRQQHMEVRAKMRKAFLAPTIDVAAIEALRKQSLGVKDQISSVMIQGFVQTAQALSPEQRQKAAHAFEMEVHAP